ncbi:hypothetical protein NIIDNTM18_15100 [Mycolicibacterium litorale]|uniref:Uncharacterized protein n=1 Tax=Mycolicibacterium litorale TaxID=758802 RepID=A0A6S6P222_9MYCO|nr:hypothetical protein NIIDNTM18_15100 [Mycolicibacterium litorale]
MIDGPALRWGIPIDRVEIKDVVLPDFMKRSDTDGQAALTASLSGHIVCTDAVST